MDHDHAFRVVLGAVFLAMLPIGIYHRVKSQATGERLDRRQEGVFILATLRPLGALFWFGLIAWLLNPAWMAWSAMPSPGWTRWMGVCLAAAGGVLLVWTFRSLGPNLTDTVVTRREHALVLHGPYGRVRHPLYDSAAMLMLGMSLMAANWFLLATSAVVFGLLIVRTRVEEEHLVARFGDSYRVYMKQTGRFLPRRRLERD